MDNKLYKPEIKEAFLNSYENEATRTTLRYLLYKAEPIESQLNKDLSNFNLNEIANVLKNTNAMSKSVVKTNARFLSSYISWAIANGHRGNEINPLSGITDEWYNDLTFKKKLFLSQQELDDMANKDLVNAQDAAVLYLYFESVMGDQSSELLNLHYNDINWNENKITLRDNANPDNPRTIEVSENCIKIIKAAYEEDSYEFENGETGREAALIRSDYIIRNIESKRANSAQLTRPTLYSRLNGIKNSLGLPFLTPNNLRKSGMIKMAVTLYQERGKIEKEELDEIAEKYGYNKVRIGNKEHYNTSVFKEFINRETILELYGVDIEA